MTVSTEPIANLLLELMELKREREEGKAKYRDVSNHTELLIRISVYVLQFSFLISPPKKTPNSQIRSTDTPSFKLAASEV